MCNLLASLQPLQVCLRADHVFTTFSAAKAQASGHDMARLCAVLSQRERLEAAVTCLCLVLRGPAIAYEVPAILNRRKQDFCCAIARLQLVTPTQQQAHGNHGHATSNGDMGTSTSESIWHMAMATSLTAQVRALGAA